MFCVCEVCCATREELTAHWYRFIKSARTFSGCTVSYFCLKSKETLFRNEKTGRANHLAVTNTGLFIDKTVPVHAVKSQVEVSTYDYVRFTPGKGFRYPLNVRRTIWRKEIFFSYRNSKPGLSDL